jgi:molybdate transport system substrate-binding protein
VKVTLTFGASRALFARTRPGRVSGPPGADVFVTSDNSVIHDLSGGSGAGDSESSGDPTNAAIFVEDVLHIVTAPGNPKHLTALGDLAKPSLRVVLERPGTPIGGGARQVLAKAGVTVAHPVGANDAAAVVAAIAGRRADAGIVDGGAAQAAGNGVTTIDIPAALNVLSSYYAAQPVDAPHRKLGLTFMTFLFSPDAQKILTDGGLQAIPCAGPIAKICAPSFDG